MFYKLSNKINLNTIEYEVGAKFRFPNLYEPSPIIDGLNEASLPIITANNKKTIEFGIWGILPEGYREEWSDFQSIRNTLNIDVRTIDTHTDYRDALEHRRCVVVVSGFFASYNFKGKIYPLYIYPKEVKLFYLAAIYNVTNDGFITFTLLLEKSNFLLSRLHNISDSMPIILDEVHKEKWLGNQFDHIISKRNDSFDELNFSSHTIVKEFYKNNIVFDSVLEPTTYKDLINLDFSRF